MTSLTDRSLEHALSLLQEDWIYSFVFSRGGSNVTQQLKYAVSRSQPVLAELQLSTQPSLQPMATVLNVDESYNLLFLPTFTSGSITVGFEVFDHSKISNSFTTVPRYIARFIRDDERGILLSIAEHPTIGVTDVTFGILSSPSHRDHVLAQFHSKAFRKAMSRIQSGIDVGLLRRGLTYCYNSVERRPCRTCREVIGTGSAGCTCKLTLKRKSHPLDLVTEVHNMGLYEGSYRGTGDLGVYSKGQCLFKLRFDACCKGRFNTDVDLQEVLLGWALQQTSGSSSPVSSVMTMSDPDGDTSLLQHRKACFPVGMAGTALPNDSNPSFETDMLYQRKACFVGDSFTKHDGITSLNMTMSDQFGDSYGCTAIELLPKEDPVQDSSHDSTNSGYLPSSQDQVLSDWSRISSILLPQRSTYKRGQDASLSDGTLRSSQAGMSFGPLLGSMPVSQTQALPLRLTKCEKFSSDLRTSTPGMKLATIPMASVVVDHSSNGGQPRKRLQPATADMKGMNMSQKNGVLDENTLKRELRKARNRESARRSSIKKNLRFQQLQEELGHAKKVETNLRSREQAIRRENLFLRAALDVLSLPQITPYSDHAGGMG